MRIVIENRPAAQVQRRIDDLPGAGTIIDRLSVEPHDDLVVVYDLDPGECVLVQACQGIKWISIQDEPRFAVLLSPSQSNSPGTGRLFEAPPNLPAKAKLHVVQTWVEARVQSATTGIHSGFYISGAGGYCLECSNTGKDIRSAVGADCPACDGEAVVRATNLLERE